MALTLVFNDGDSDAFDCAAGSKKGYACGGVPPYAFTVSKGTIVADNFTFTITPPSNTGSGVAGVAYSLGAKFCGPLGFNECVCQDFGCDGLAETACVEFGCQGEVPVECSCSGGTDNCTLFATSAPSCAGLPVFGSSCAGLAVHHYIKDKRTAQMIADGCKPCVVEMGGAIVTVTDSEGNSVSRTLDT